MNLSNGISTIETQPRVFQQIATRPQTQTQGQFKKCPQLQILQRPSNDQQIPPPLLIDDQKTDDSTLLITEDIKNLENTFFQTTIVPIPQNQTSQENQENSQVSKYQEFS